jgi:RHS repeat-associated protein
VLLISLSKDDSAQMRKLASACVYFVLNLFFQQGLNAQNYIYQTGNPTFSTQIPIENGFINVNNGDIHIEIPLATHAQRGSLQLNERLVYDSRIWKIIQNGSSYSWQPTNVPNSMGGWAFYSGIGSGTVSYSTYESSVSCYGTIPYYVYWYFNWTDPQGTQHAFPGVETQYYNSGSVPPNCTQSNVGISNYPTSGGYASDGSGYYASVSNFTNVVIYDSQGNQYNPSIIENNPPPTTAEISDSNGNYWSQDSNGNLIDTLGRTPVLVSKSGNLIYYDVLGVNGARERYTVTTETVSYNTDFLQSDVTEAAGSFTAIQSIELPNGTSYSFSYDTGTGSGNYGELASVTLPTGGVIQYGYTNFLDSFQNQNRWVHTRLKDGGTTTFTPTIISQCSGSTPCEEKTTVTSPAGNDTVYTFTLDPSSINNASSWNTGIDAYQGSSTSGGTKLKSVNTAYTYASYSLTLNEHGTGNTVVGSYQVPSTTTSTAILDDVGLASQTKTALDITGTVPTSVQLWDYYSSSGSAPSTPTLKTAYTYYGLAHPSQITVTDGSGNQVSQTNYGYDQSTPIATSGIVHHNATSGGGYNLTTVSQWVGTSASPLTTTEIHHDTGTLQSSTSPNGTTSYGYDGTDTFVTSATPPTPSSGVSLGSTAIVDNSTGLPSSATDPNGAQVSYRSYDSLSRPLEIDYPIGKTTYTYYPNQVSDFVYQNATVYQDTETLFDGYGRVSRVAVANGQSSNPWYQNDTCYDTSGNVKFRSYSYQGNGWSTPEVCSGAGDTSTYDALGRVLTITHGDGTSVNYSYQGRATKVVDENGVARITQIDGLGRTIAVCEISSNSSMPGGAGSTSPVACGTDVTGTGFLTGYSYNLANHMKTVTQGVQQRLFQTDAAGRTISSTEPERGATNYSYAYNSTGLVVTRNRAQANQPNSSTLTTTTTQYDSMGRVVAVTYNDGFTPNKNFYYDSGTNWSNGSSATNLKGNLSVMSAGVSAANNTSALFSYDLMGHVTTMWQCAPSTCQTVSGQLSRAALTFSYDQAGNLTGEFDGASGLIAYGRSTAGEVTSITNQTYINTYNPANLVSNVVNGPNGPISYTLGNGLNIFNQYDSLGRSSGHWVCTGAPQVNCGGQVYGTNTVWRGSRATAGNDTVIEGEIDYGYDEFNRLTSTNQNLWNSTQRNFTYVYDRYGNRWSQTVTAGSGPSPSISFNTSNNQITTGGYTYDAAGNMSSDGLHNYTYDEEGNILSVDGGATAQYAYDAMNRRVRVQTASSTNEYMFDYAGRRTSTWQVSNNFGDEGRIYWDGNQIAFRSEDGTTYFDHQDVLGTERMQTNYAGNVASTYGSLPWGDAYTPSVISSGGDQDNLHFALLDHDTESNTEHAQFRQYSSAQGRWMSPDPYDGSYDYSNPQSLNRYAYVGNNPLGFTDPTGLQNGEPPPASGGGDCGIICVGIDIGITALASEIASLFDQPSFHGTLHPRPPSAITQGANGAYYMSVYGQAIAPASGIDPIPVVLSTLIAPSNGFGAKPGGCMVVNGRTVCPSPIDNKYSLDNAGQRDYRENKPGCNLHVAVNNQTGQLNNPHMDQYNPNYQLFNHLFLDWLPDKIYDLTGQYLIPAGRTFCP